MKVFFPASSVSDIYGFYKNGQGLVKGDAAKLPTTVARTLIVTSAVANTAANLGAMSKAAGSAMGVVDKLGDALKISNLGAKATNISKKVTDPLTFAHGALTVARDDNKKAAAVEQGFALGAWYGVEYLMKAVRNPIEKLVQQGASGANIADGIKGLLEPKSGVNKLGKKLLESEKGAKFVTSAVDGISKMSKGQKAAVGIGIGVAFTAVSVAVSSLGKKLGQKITGRTDDKAQKA
jgi:hypothetical protein